MLLFEEKISRDKEAFIAKLMQVAADLEINPNWLMAVINSETGGTFRADTLNKAGSGAVGLIQFMPATATDLGTTTAELQHMSEPMQLDYVYKYFKPYKNYINKFEDLYLITFFPNADAKFAGTLSKPDDWQFPSYVTPGNRGIDTDASGRITIKEFRDFIWKRIPLDAIPLITESAGAVVTAKKAVLRNWIPISIAAVLLSIGTYLILSKSK